jgi:hypothetical protein
MFYKKTFNNNITIGTALILIILIIPSIQAEINPLGWSKKINLTEKSEPFVVYEKPSIASDGDNVYVFWQNEYNSEEQGDRIDIFYKKSNDRGNTWSEIQRLTDNAFHSVDCSVAVNNSNIHVVWNDYRDSTCIYCYNGEIYYKVSHDNGSNWSEDIRLTYNNNRSYEPNIAIHRNNIHVAWKDYRNGAAEIYYKKSNDSGYNWSEDIRLTNDTTPSYSPAIAVYNNNVHVVWEDIGRKHEIYYKKSIDNGKTWTDYILLSHGKDDSKLASIAADNKNIHVVWQDYRDDNYEIYYKRSIDNGKTWEKEKRLTFSKNDSYNPKIDVFKDNIHVIWREKINENQVICYKRSNDNGETWENEIELTDKNNNSHAPSLSVNKEKIHLTWQDYMDTTKILYMKKINYPPTVNSLDFSNISSDNINNKIISVYGEDKEDNKSDLLCIVQYKIDSNEWIEINTTFKDDHWKATFSQTEITYKNTLNLRAKLTDTVGESSNWYEQQINIKENNNKNTPGFEITTILMIIVLFIYITYKKNKQY